MDKRFYNQSEIESEPRTVAPITMVYRAGPTLKKGEGVVRDIEEAIHSMGGDIEIVEYPQGETPDIEAWTRENAEYLKGRALLTDNTCKPEYGTVESSVYSKAGYLDTIVATAEFDALKEQLDPEFFKGKEGVNSDSTLDSVESYQNFYPKMFRMVFEQIPIKKMYVIPKDMKDHFPLPSDGHSEPVTDEFVAERFKEYIEQSDFPSEAITIQSLADTEEIEQTLTEEDLVLFDRHARENHTFGKATILVIPFSNFMRSLSEKGLIKVPEEKVRENLKHSLPRYFKKDLALEDVQWYMENHYAELNRYDLDPICTRSSEEEIKKILYYLSGLIINDEGFPFIGLGNFLPDAKIADELRTKVINKIIKGAIAKQGVEKFANYLAKQEKQYKLDSAALIENLDPHEFEELIALYENN